MGSKGADGNMQSVGELCGNNIGEWRVWVCNHLPTEVHQAMLNMKPCRWFMRRDVFTTIGLRMPLPQPPQPFNTPLDEDVHAGDDDGGDESDDVGASSDDEHKANKRKVEWYSRSWLLKYHQFIYQLVKFQVNPTTKHPAESNNIIGCWI